MKPATSKSDAIYIIPVRQWLAGMDPTHSAYLRGKLYGRGKTYPHHSARECA
ncbi:MAG: hypothetical protein M0Z36_08915 [Thermaerobacter sp.]|nr:hypothetical protein [Thermaerobacter sp.]